jgi:pectin-derived oligosaccharide transport system substrate-binding protein
MTLRLSRRGFGGLVAGAAAASTFASVGAFAQGKSVRLIWWGNPDRDRRTNEVIALYTSKTGTEVVPETYAWNDYWQKLATQAAGRNLPDVIQMDYRFIFEYARRNQLAALDEFVGSQLALDDFDSDQLASGKVDGKLYGVSMGANSMTHVYNQKLLGELGVELPDPTTWTLEDWTAIGRDLKGKLPEGMYFTMNMAWEEPRFETWVRQRGKELYTPDGQLGYELEDLIAHFAFWKGLQDEGLTPPADIQAQDASGKMEESMFTTGRALFGFIHSNQMVANQKLVPDEINITMIPNQVGGQPGQYLKPSMFLSMAETTADKPASAELLNFFITDPEANAILAIERGVSADASIREELVEGLSETERKVITYLDIVATSHGPLPPPPPQSAGELQRALRPAWDAVSFEQVSVEEGAKEYYDNAVAILARA